jgi:hypothetical protein
LQVILLLHFRLSIAVMSAQKPQSEKAISYINSHFRKISKYLEGHGWKNISDSKSRIEWIDDNGDTIYIRIVVATRSGANCLDPNTVVHTSQGIKKLSEVTTKDLILTRDYRNGLNVYQNVSFIANTQKPTIEIQFEDGSNLICSTDHQIFTHRGWVTADQLKIGTPVIPLSNTPIKNNASNNEIKIERDLRQMILGSMLGDSSFDRLPSGSVRFKVSHCPEQLEYLEEIKLVFKNNNIGFSEYTSNKICNGRKYIAHGIVTHTHDIFKELYHITHHNNKKTVTKQWLDLLNIEGISYFVMDDGARNSKIIGKSKESFLDLSVCSFTEDENSLIIQKLKEYGINSYMMWVTNSSKKKYPIIRINKDDSRDLSEKMYPYFVNCLRHKLLTPKTHVRFRRCIDTGKPIILESKDRYNGFKLRSDAKIKDTQKYRDYIKNIKRQLKLKVSNIKHLGITNLIDLSIKTDDEHLKSFFANNTLVHNSEHLPVLLIDEIDLIADPQALEEAKMIPSSYKGYSPITIGLSTLKYSGGLMEKFINDTKKMGGEVYKWNIIDVTERLPEEVLEKDKPKQVRYISSELPMENLSEEEWRTLPSERQSNYERIETYHGISKHPLLPVMKNYLAERPKKDKGGLYKKVTAVINNFKQVSPDMASAQLLCKKPSTRGLVYPKFIPELNTLNLDQAYLKITGVEKTNVTLDEFSYVVKNFGLKVQAGVDWGFTNEYAVVVSVMMPNNHMIIVDTFAAPGQELEDCVRIATEMKERWNIDTFYCDPAYPAYIKTFNRNGLKSPKFTKDVARGIESVRSVVADSANIRRLFILDTINNKRLIDGFSTYHWKLNAAGEPTDKPDHTEESDIMDALRYLCENTNSKNNRKILSTYSENDNGKFLDKDNPLGHKIKQLAVEDQEPSQKNKKIRITW